jgi:hypothetical protein
MLRLEEINQKYSIHPIEDETGVCEDKKNGCKEVMDDEV